MKSETELGRERLKLALRQEEDLYFALQFREMMVKEADAKYRAAYKELVLAEKHLAWLVFKEKVQNAYQSLLRFALRK